VVLWRLRYRLSLRDLAEMFLVRGFVFIYEAVREWEGKLTPSLTEDLRRMRKGKEHRRCWALLPSLRRTPCVPTRTIPHAPARACIDTTLSPHAENRYRAWHTGGRLGGNQTGANSIIDRWARGLTEPVRPGQRVNARAALWGAGCQV
jgi:hypothetical protein